MFLKILCGSSSLFNAVNSSSRVVGGLVLGLVYGGIEAFTGTNITVKIKSIQFYILKLRELRHRNIVHRCRQFCSLCTVSSNASSKDEHQTNTQTKRTNNKGRNSYSKYSGSVWKFMLN